MFSKTQNPITDLTMSKTVPLNS